ncbi:MAG: outer membrane beta-barrel protein [Ramlibacter sp.]
MISARNTAALGWLAAAALASPTALAQAQGSGWYAGGALGATAATIDDDRIVRGLAAQGLATSSLSDDERDMGYKLFGGYQVNRNFGIEAGWFDLGEMGYRATTTPPGTLRGDVKVRGFNLDAVGTLPLTDRLSLLGRVGVAQVRTRGSFAATGAVTNPYGGTRRSATDTGLKLGAGLSWRLAEAWEVRGEYERLRIDDSVGNRGHVDMLSLGLVYRFGGSPPAPRAAAPAPAFVAAAPAPAPAPMVIPAPAPMPAPVVRPAPTRVHFSADALFGFDESTLRPEGARELDAFAGQLRGVEYDKVSVTGHTDRLGPAAYNERLSRQRAESVGAHLVRAGVPAAKLSTSGAGETAPVTASGACKGQRPTAALRACLQPDRRVEVEVDGLRTSGP